MTAPAAGSSDTPITFAILTNATPSVPAVVQELPVTMPTTAQMIARRVGARGPRGGMTPRSGLRRAEASSAPVMRRATSRPRAACVPPRRRLLPLRRAEGADVLEHDHRLPADHERERGDEPREA